MADNGGLPHDWRERFVEMVRGAEPLREDWFTGGPALTALEQVAVYKNQYRLRLYDAVAEEVPGLVHLLGGGAEPTLRAYLHDHPSGAWTLNRVADRLADWLEERQNPKWLVEMARLDRAVQAGFEAADSPPLDPSELATMPPLRLQPHVSLLRLTWNVHWIRSAVMNREESVPALEEGNYPVVVFRRDRRMRHWQMPRGAFEILWGIQEGRSVESAVDAAFQAGALNVETLGADIGTWFKDYSERNLVAIDRS